MGLIAVARKELKLGSDTIGFGETFDPKKYGDRKWTSMQDRGDIDFIYREDDDDAPVAPAEGEGASATPSDEGVAESPYHHMNRKELIAHLESRDVDPDSIEGSGSDGYVTVDDIRAELVRLDNAEQDED